MNIAVERDKWGRKGVVRREELKKLRKDTYNVTDVEKEAIWIMNVKKRERWESL